MVTGSNSGIGLAVAQAFGNAGAHVVLAVRDLDKGRAAAETVPGSREVRRLDLAELSWSASSPSRGPGDRGANQHAGVMPSRGYAIFETIGTNCWSLRLTNFLLPHITDRVVNLGSMAHWWGRINFDDLTLGRNYGPHQAYAQSKLANMLFTVELQRRLAEAGSPVLAAVAHPGWAATNLQSHSTSRLALAAMAVGNRLIAHEAACGAQPTLYAATQNLPGATSKGPRKSSGSAARQAAPAAARPPETPNRPSGCGAHPRRSPASLSRRACRTPGEFINDLRPPPWSWDARRGLGSARWRSRAMRLSRRRSISQGQRKEDLATS